MLLSPYHRATDPNETSDVAHPTPHQHTLPETARIYPRIFRRQVCLLPNTTRRVRTTMMGRRRRDHTQTVNRMAAAHSLSYATSKRDGIRGSRILLCSHNKEMRELPRIFNCLSSHN